MAMLKMSLEGLFAMIPDTGHLNLFGSQVCVKQMGKCQSKLDKHKFKGIFIGYLATDHNVVYLDLDLVVVKQSHHAQFDKAWYLQPICPPVAQLLYELGVEPDTTLYSEKGIVLEDHSELEFHPPGTVEHMLEAI
jgi:hypothetical protein